MGPFDVAVAAVIFGSLSAVMNSWIRMRQATLKSEREASPGIEDRLTRIEHAVDAISTEVERLAEAQQFTSRLLSERLPTGLPSGHERGHS